VCVERKAGLSRETLAKTQGRNAAAHVSVNLESDRHGHWTRKKTAETNEYSENDAALGSYSKAIADQIL